MFIRIESTNKTLGGRYKNGVVTIRADRIESVGEAGAMLGELLIAEGSCITMFSGEKFLDDRDPSTMMEAIVKQINNLYVKAAH